MPAACCSECASSRTHRAVRNAQGGAVFGVLPHQRQVKRHNKWLWHRHHHCHPQKPAAARRGDGHRNVAVEAGAPSSSTATAPVTKDDLVEYLRKGCKPVSAWR